MESTLLKSGSGRLVFKPSRSLYDSSIATVTAAAAEPNTVITREGDERAKKLFLGYTTDLSPVLAMAF
jgi:hypothetical protein